MMQSVLLDFRGDEITPQVHHESQHVPQKEELTVELSSEDLRINQLTGLRKIYEDYREIIKKSVNGREVIFAVKFTDSLKAEIKRLEREVSH